MGHRPHQAGRRRSLRGDLGRGPVVAAVVDEHDLVADPSVQRRPHLAGDPGDIAGLVVDGNND